MVTFHILMYQVEVSIAFGYEHIESFKSLVTKNCSLNHLAPLPNDREAAPAISSFIHMGLRVYWYVYHMFSALVQ